MMVMGAPRSSATGILCARSHEKPDKSAGGEGRKRLCTGTEHYTVPHHNKEVGPMVTCSFQTWVQQ